MSALFGSTSMLKPCPDCAGRYHEPVTPGTIENAGAAALTVRLSGNAWVRLPDVPVMVMLAVPVAAVELAFNVSVEDEAPFAAKLAVTPVGRPLAVKLTVPEN